MIDLDNLIRQIQEIIQKEYKIVLNQEKKDLLQEFNYKFLHLNDLASFQDNIVFFNLAILCGEINPLKIILIDLESLRIIQKYKLQVKIKPTLMFAQIIKEKILNDLPFNPIFLDSEVEIFNYLANEKGVKVAKIYHELSSNLEKKYQNENFDLINYLNNYITYDYQEIEDYLFDIINQKVLT